MQAIEPLVDNASDPFGLISLEGNLLWANSALQSILKQTDSNSISELFSEDHFSDIRDCLHFKTIEVELRLSKEVLVPQTLLCISLPSGNPDKELIAVFFKSYASEAEDVRQHQEMLLTAAHDLKNPLGAIFGYSDLLLDTPTGDSLSEDQRGIISRVRATADRAINLLRNYQYLSDRRLRSLSKTKAQVDLCAVAGLILDSVRHEVKEALPIKINLPQKSCYVNAGRTEVERVVSNLISNAVKYTPSTGSISVSIEEDKELAGFRVVNTGAPIPQKELPLLFNKFSRVSTSSGKSGTGLGLYIVKRILEALGGSIEISSDKESTTACAYFPKAKGV